MNINTGDKVKFLNEIGEGTVIEIINSKRAMVRVEDGFDIPFMISELIKIEPEKSKQPKETKGTPPPAEKSIIEKQDYAHGVDTETINPTDEISVYLALVPEIKDFSPISMFDIYLINNSNYKMLFTLSYHINDKKIILVKSGFIEANTKILIETVSVTKLNNQPQFVFQAILFKQKEFALKQTIESKINIKPVELNKGTIFKKCEFFNSKVALYTLYQDNMSAIVNALDTATIGKIIKEKEKTQPSAPQPVKPKKEFREIDLHIHELVEDERGMSNKEMLDTQISQFKKELDVAIKNQEKKIIFIHGKGNGILKQEIRNIIQRNYPNCDCQDASFQEYGFGATLILVKRF